MNPLALAHLTVLDASPPDLVSAAAAAGFDSVGLRIVPPLPGEPVFPLLEDASLLKQTRQRLADTGLRVLDVEAIWLTPQADVSTLRPALELANALGASYVLAVGHDPDSRRLHDQFAQLCQLARPFGLQVMLEFISYCAISSWVQALALVRAAGDGNAGVLIDALHFFRMSTDPAALSAARPAELAYVQLCDAPLRSPPPEERRAEARTNRLYPGLGELPLGSLLRHLPPGIPLSVEAPCAGDRSLSITDRAIRAAAATRRFLAASL
jgi:sugar phosphate isomerase/epimerase